MTTVAPTIDSISPGSEPADQGKGSFLLTVTVMSAWVILLFVFSTPERDTAITIGGLDVIGAAKAVSRLGTLCLLVAINLMMVGSKPIRFVVYYMIGFFLYAAWAGVTVLWSPMPDVSAGQWISMLTMIALGATAVRLVESDRDVQLVLTMLALLLVTRSGIMLICWAVTGGTGVSREAESYYHSTDAAETASLGLLVLMVAHLGFPSRFSRLVFLPCMFVLLSLFLIAQNRLTLVITPPLVLICMLMYGNRKAIVNLAFIGSLAVTLFLLFDPGLETLSSAAGSTEQLARRSDQDDRAFSTFNGRTELWEVIWNEYITRPMTGLGFFVTSRTGEIDVWEQPLNYTAHNQLFQVLATTGLIGLFFFLVGFVGPVRMMISRITRSGPAGHVARSVAVIFAWLVLWGLLNTSFSGPIGASSVAFWLLVGLTIGRLWEPDAETEQLRVYR